MNKWQEKMLESDKRIIICNWGRGKGKTQAIFNKIIRQDSGVFVYFNINKATRDWFKFVFKEYFEDNCYGKIAIYPDKIICSFDNGTEYEILLLGTNIESIKGYKKIDMVFYDDCFPDIESFESILENIHVKQFYVMFSNSNVEYIDDNYDDDYDDDDDDCYYDYSEDDYCYDYGNDYDDYDDDDYYNDYGDDDDDDCEEDDDDCDFVKFDFNDFVDYAIFGLSIEFQKLLGNINSIEKRNDILDMIDRLDSMRK